MDLKNISDKFSWTNPVLIIKSTGSRGKGIFTTKEIEKGDVVAIFGGYVMPINDAEKMPGDYADKGIQISEKHELTPGINMEKADFFNHSCDPNTGFKGQIFLVAMRDIEAGEEISFDYAMCLFDDNTVSEYKLECRCGSKKCRKIVTSSDWKKKDIISRYNGYFQTFLQEKINKIYEE